MPGKRGGSSKQPPRPKSSPDARDRNAAARKRSRFAEAKAAQASIFLPPALTGGRPKPAQKSIVEKPRKATSQEIAEAAVEEWRTARKRRGAALGVEPLREQPDNLINTAPRNRREAFRAMPYREKLRWLDLSPNDLRLSTIRKRTREMGLPDWFAVEARKAVDEYTKDYGYDLKDASLDALKGVGWASREFAKRLRNDRSTPAGQILGLSDRTVEAAGIGTTPGDVLESFVRAGAEMTLGLIPGTVYAATDPMAFLDAAKEDFKNRYGRGPRSMEEFVEWLPYYVADAITIAVPAAKGAELAGLGSKAGRLVEFRPPIRHPDGRITEGKTIRLIKVTDPTTGYTAPVMGRRSALGRYGQRAATNISERATAAATARGRSLPASLDARKRITKALRHQDEVATERFLAPAKSFAVQSRRVRRNKGADKAYEAWARSGGDLPEALEFLRKELIWRDGLPPTQEQRAAIAKIRLAQRFLSKPENVEALRPVLESGRSLTEAVQGYMIERGLLTEETARSAIAQPVKQIENLPDIEHPIRSAMVDDIRSLGADADVTGALVDVLDSSAWRWARATGEEPARWFDQFQHAIPDANIPEAALAQYGDRPPHGFAKNVEDNRLKMRQRVSDDMEAYQPVNENMAGVTGRSGVPLVGPRTVEERLARIMGGDGVTAMLSAEQMLEWKTFYREVWPSIAGVYGADERYAIAWFLSQKGAGPGRGMLDLQKILEREPGKIGLAADEMRAVLEAPEGAPVGERGIGAKISDFLDSGHGQSGRTITGGRHIERPLPGDMNAPFVVDRWSQRSDGFIDKDALRQLRRLGHDPDALEIKIDKFNDSNYEYSSIKGNQLTTLANERKLGGLDNWTYDEIQALDWAATQLDWGVTPEHMRAAVEANVRGVTTELSFPADSALGKTYNARLLALDEETRAAVAREILPIVARIASEKTGARIVEAIFGPGGFMGDTTSTSTLVRIHASAQGTRDFIAIVGDLLQQQEVWAARTSVGKRPYHALDIIDVDNPTALFAELRKTHADDFVGFTPIKGGMRVIFADYVSDGVYTPRRVNRAALEQAVRDASDALGIETRGNWHRAEVEVWHRGLHNRQGLQARGRGVDRRDRAVLASALEDAVSRAETGGRGALHQRGRGGVEEAAGSSLAEVIRELGPPESWYERLQTGDITEYPQAPKLDADGWGRQPPRVADRFKVSMIGREGLISVREAEAGVAAGKYRRVGNFEYEVVGSERPPEFLYRAISEDDWVEIQRRGYMQSDQRMNLSQTEGTAAAMDSPTFYLPGGLASSKPGVYRGRIVRIRYRDKDGWRHDRDGYVKTDKQIPIDQIDMVTPVLERDVTLSPKGFTHAGDWRVVRPPLAQRGRGGVEEGGPLRVGSWVTAGDRGNRGRVVALHDDGTATVSFYNRQTGEKATPRLNQDLLTTEAPVKGAFLQAENSPSGLHSVQYTDIGDASTVIHEVAGHGIVETILRDLWDSLPAAERRTLTRRYNLPEGGPAALTPAKLKGFHERFARDMERIFVDRRPPRANPRLAAIHRKLRDEMRAIYENSRPGRAFSPEERRVVGSLLDATYGLEPAEGAFHIPSIRREPLRETVGLRRSINRPREHLYERSGSTFEQGREIGGVRSTTQGALQKLRIEGQWRRVDEVVAPSSKPLPLGELPDEGWVVWNPNVKLRGVSRALEELQAGKMEFEELMAQLEAMAPDELATWMGADTGEMFPSWNETLSETAGLRQVPKVVADAYAATYMSQSTNDLYRAVAWAFDTGNNVARLGAIYLRPAYFTVNFAGNAAFASIQGSFMPWNLPKNWGLLHSLPKEVRAMLDIEVGQGGALALAGPPKGALKTVTHAVAEVQSTLADRGPRRIALIHELRTHGYDTAEKIINLLDDARAGDANAAQAMNLIGQRAEEAMVRFRGLDDFERKIVSRAIFVYPWMKGAARYGLQFPGDHPLLVAPFAQIGQYGWDEMQRRRGEVNMFLRGYMPLPWASEEEKGLMGDIYMKLVGTENVSPLTTAAEVIEAIYGSTTGRGVARIGDMISPPLDIAIQVGLGLDTYTGERTGRNLLDVVEREASTYSAPLMARKLIQGDEGSSSFGPGTRLDTVMRWVLGVWPRKANLTEARKRAQRELGYAERFERKVKKEYEAVTSQVGELPDDVKGAVTNGYAVEYAEHLIRKSYTGEKEKYLLVVLKIAASDIALTGTHRSLEDFNSEYGPLLPRRVKESEYESVLSAVAAGREIVGGVIGG